MSKAKQGVWFLLVGASAALTHFLLLVVAVQIFDMPPTWGNLVAFLFAFVVSFVGHYQLTFAQKHIHPNVNTLPSGDTSSDTNQQISTAKHKPAAKGWHSSLIKWFVS